MHGTVTTLRDARPDAFAIVTATDAAMEDLAIALCRSLGDAARWLVVFDIGMTEAARAWFAGAGVPVRIPPAGALGRAPHDSAYFSAMYLRPQLPRMLPARSILWIDADCWVQDAQAILEFREAAEAAPGGVAACVMIDPDYPGCITSLVADQDWYRDLHRPLLGDDAADFLYGRAVLSSGVFCARADAPFWPAWEAEVRRIYDEIRPTGVHGHMAEQCAFNLVMHRMQGFAVLRSENNWHCHGAPMKRRGSRVVVAASGRAPRIVHLSAFRANAAEYRARRLLFEPDAAAPAVLPPGALDLALRLADAEAEVASLRARIAALQAPGRRGPSGWRGLLRRDRAPVHDRSDGPA
jgi:hypothetical protein